jgi:hypothetical protein
MPLSMVLALLLQLPQATTDSVVAAVFAAEQARAGTASQLAVLVNASRHADTTVQRIAVRALGRLERPSVLPVLTAALADAAPGVRIEAANAVAQGAVGNAPLQLVHCGKIVASGVSCNRRCVTPCHWEVDLVSPALEPARPWRNW